MTTRLLQDKMTGDLEMSITQMKQYTSTQKEILFLGISDEVYIQTFAHGLKELPKFEEGLPTSDTDFIVQGLEYDYLRICDLLGFHTITRPILTFEKEEFLTAALEFGYNPPHVSDWRGLCILEGNIIFININIKSDYKLSDGVLTNARPTYITFLETLIHELVHFKCPDMECTEVKDDMLVGVDEYDNEVVKILRVLNTHPL